MKRHNGKQSGFFSAPSTICVEGEILVCDPKTSTEAVPTVKSFGATTCVILTLVDATNPKNCAIGHFDSPVKLETSVTSMLAVLIQAGAKRHNIQATLTGGVSGLSLCFSSRSLYTAIKDTLEFHEVSNIKYENYSLFIFWTHRYDVSINRENGQISV